MLLEPRQLDLFSGTNVFNDTITSSNPSETFEIFTDELVVAFMYEHAYPRKIPVCPVNDMSRDTQ